MSSGSIKLDYPPRVKGKIISGNYFDFFQNQLDFLSNSAEKFGDVVHLRFFHLPVYLINHPDLIEEVFSKKAPTLGKLKLFALLCREFFLDAAY